MTRRVLGGTALLAALIVVTASSQVSAGGGGGLRLAKVADFDRPVYVHGPKGARGLLFVVEQAGRVRVVEDGRKLKGAFLNIRRKVSSGGERGLLSIAFANFKRSRRFYVYFTDGQGDLRVVEYKRKRGKLKAAKGSARNILEIPHRRFANHNGGQLQFGPDGNLWLATGDGGGADDPGRNAQDKDSLLGKLLRIDPSRKGKRRPYGIPKANPYRGQPGRDEIYARGLRNPWRFSFDRKKIVIGDVGQSAREEVDFERTRGARGANFGWDPFEGTVLREPPAPSRHDRPIFQYETGPGGTCAITGGYVVRDPELRSLRGRYVYGDFCAGEIRGLDPGLNGANGDGGLGLPRVSSLSSFGVDARKRVYVSSLDGGVWRIAPG